MCVILHTVGGLRYFVARQFLSQIYTLLSVKFPGLKICECKKDDKYQVYAEYDDSTLSSISKVAVTEPLIKVKMLKKC